MWSWLTQFTPCTAQKTQYANKQGREVVHHMQMPFRQNSRLVFFSTALDDLI